MAAVTTPGSAPPSHGSGPGGRLTPPLITAAALGMVFEGRHSLQIVMNCIQSCEIENGMQLLSCAWKMDDVTFSALELHGTLLLLAFFAVVLGLVHVFRKKH